MQPHQCPKVHILKHEIVVHPYGTLYKCKYLCVLVRYSARLRHGSVRPAPEAPVQGNPVRGLQLSEGGIDRASKDAKLSSNSWLHLHVDHIHAYGFEFVMVDLRRPQVALESPVLWNRFKDAWSTHVILESQTVFDMCV